MSETTDRPPDLTALFGAEAVGRARAFRRFTSAGTKHVPPLSRLLVELKAKTAAPGFLLRAGDARRLVEAMNPTLFASKTVPTQHEIDGFFRLNPRLSFSGVTITESAFAHLAHESDAVEAGCTLSVFSVTMTRSTIERWWMTGAAISFPALCAFHARANRRFFHDHLTTRATLVDLTRAIQGTDLGLERTEVAVTTESGVWLGVNSICEVANRIENGAVVDTTPVAMLTIDGYRDHDEW